MSFLILPATLRPKDMEGETTVIGDFVFLKDYLSHFTRGRWPHFLVFTKTGFVNSEAFLACMDKVLDIWELRNPGLTGLFLGDNLGPHRTLQLLQKMIEKGHFNWYIPTQSSGWNAMPDDIPFLVLKKLGELQSERTVWDSLLTDENYRWNVFIAFMKAERDAFKPKLVREAFKNVGLVNKHGKFDKELVTKRMEENLGSIPGRDAYQDAAMASRDAASAIISNSFENVKKKV